VGIRELFQNRPSLAITIAAVMIVGAAVAIFLQARSSNSVSSGTYFTTDNGQTLFVDQSTRIPPFDHDGKPACRAHVFMCGGTRVVGYLSRYTEQAKKIMDEAKSYQGTGKPPPNARQLASIGTTGLEVKRPGDVQWVSQADAVRAARVRTFVCPDGSTPSEVYP
jgi:hypothetical protein